MASKGSGVFVELRKRFAILWLRNGENRFNTQFVKELHSALDQVERNKDVQFLITIGKGKFYSNGLDLDRLVEMNKTARDSFVSALHALFLRILTFPVPTIAALNGHSFAAGAIFASSHDYRLMRTQQGWYCLPEIQLKLRFSDGMMSILKAKITDPRIQIESIILGKRYTAEQALSSKLVDQICDNSELLNKAIEFGLTVVGNETFDRQHMTHLKSDLYQNAVKHLSMKIVKENAPGQSKL